MKKEDKVVLKYHWFTNDKGERVLMPKYLEKTPDEEISRMNNEFKEWKTTVQKKHKV